MRAPAGAGSIGLDRAGAKHQGWDVERQDDQRQQCPLAACAEGQRRGEAADQAQGRSAEQQTQRQNGDRAAVEIEEQRQERAGQRQRQPGCDPVRGAFCQHRELERQAR